MLVHMALRVEGVQHDDGLLSIWELKFVLTVDLVWIRGGMWTCGKGGGL